MYTEVLLISGSDRRSGERVQEIQNIYTITLAASRDLSMSRA